MILNLEWLINLLLCIVIFLLAYWGYRIRRDIVPFLVGIAFGLFGISHFFKILDLDIDLANILIVIRVLGYLLVVLALYMRLRRGSLTARCTS
jgi:hypothetical protein